MMDATERMTYIASLDLDLETTYAIMRLDYTSEEIATALHAQSREVLDRWRDTLRLISVPKGQRTTF